MILFNEGREKNKENRKMKKENKINTYRKIFVRVWILWILGKILLHMKPLALLLQVVLLFCFQTKTSPNKQHFSQINNLSFFSRSVTNWSCSRFMVRRGVYFGSVSGPALSIRYLMEPRLWQDRIDSPFRHCSSFHLNRLQISEYRLIMLYKK